MYKIYVLKQLAKSDWWQTEKTFLFLQDFQTRRPKTNLNTFPFWKTKFTWNDTCVPFSHIYCIITYHAKVKVLWTDQSFNTCILLFTFRARPYIKTVVKSSAFKSAPKRYTRTYKSSEHHQHLQK